MLLTIYKRYPLAENVSIQELEECIDFSKGINFFLFNLGITEDDLNDFKIINEYLITPILAYKNIRTTDSGCFLKRIRVTFQLMDRALKAKNINRFLFLVETVFFVYDAIYYDFINSFLQDTNPDEGVQKVYSLATQEHLEIDKFKNLFYFFANFSYNYSDEQLKRNCQVVESIPKGNPADYDNCIRNFKGYVINFIKVLFLDDIQVYRCIDNLICQNSSLLLLSSNYQLRIPLQYVTASINLLNNPNNWINFTHHIQTEYVPETITLTASKDNSHKAITNDVEIEDSSKNSYQRRFTNDEIHKLFTLLIDAGYITESNAETYELFHLRINGTKSKDYEFNPNKKIRWRSGCVAFRDFLYMSRELFMRQYSKSTDFFEFPGIDDTQKEKMKKYAKDYIEVKKADFTQIDNIINKFKEYRSIKGKEL